MTKKKLFLIVSIMGLIALIATGCGPKTSTTATPTAVTGSSSNAGEVVAQGRIVPKDSTDLFFESGGVVEEVLVKQGDSVTKGTPLIKLGERDQAESALATAQAELLAAQKQVDDLKRTADLAYQQAVLAEITAEEAYYAAQKNWDSFDEEAQQTKIDDQQAKVNTAKSDLEDAQKEFDKYSSLDKDNADRQRTKNALDNAEKAYHDAEKALADLENEGAQLEAELQLAQDQLNEATRATQQRKDGPDPDELAQAQARLDSATSGQAAAQEALDRMTLVAPYDGVIASLDVSAGERVTPGAAIISFADVSEWYIETKDLNENEVVDVHTGQQTTATLDAIPGLELAGEVESIAQTYTEDAGDIVYKTRIRLTDVGSAPLRWGMTTEVRFNQTGN